MVVGWYLFKVQVFIERSGGFHLAERVQQYMVIARHPGCIHDGLSQLPAQTEPAMAIPYIQPLHLASVGVVAGCQRAHRTAARQLAVNHGQQQRTVGLGVFAGQVMKLGLKVLKAQVNAKLLRVFLEKLPRRLKLGGRGRRDELDVG